MRKARKDLKKKTKDKDEQQSAHNTVDLKDFLGVPVYELTARDERAQAAVNAKYQQSNCDTAEFEEALESYLNARYPWRRIRTAKSDQTSDKCIIQGKLRVIHRCVIEHDFGSIFKIGEDQQYFYLSFKDYPPHCLPPQVQICLRYRGADQHRGIFRYSLSNAIGRIEIIWDSLRTIAVLVERLRPMENIIQQLCLFRDCTNLNSESQCPEFGDDEFTYYLYSHMASAARSAYFMLQFVAYMYLDTESQSTSSGGSKYKDCTLSIADFNEMFQLIAAAAEELPMLEENICDKLCEIFNLKSREEAKKHDWFKFFTFCDWTWLLGPERSFLDFVGGRTESSSATASSDTTVDRINGCQHCEKPGAQTCPECLGEIKDVLLGNQKLARELTSFVKEDDLIYDDMVVLFTKFPSTGFCCDQTLTTLHQVAMVMPRFVSHVVNRSLLALVRHAKFLLAKCKVCISPHHMLRLQYLCDLAMLQCYTYDTEYYFASGDIAIDKDAENFHCRSRSLCKQIDDYTVSIVKLLRDLR